MKNENKVIQNPADYDYLKASSVQDCTGLIPSGIVDEAEIESYEELYPFLTSTSSKNFTNYNNPAYDELFRQAVTTMDEAVQTDLYKQMQKMLTETAANLYIQDLCDLVVTRHNMAGVQFYPTFVMDLSGVQWVTE